MINKNLIFRININICTMRLLFLIVTLLMVTFIIAQTPVGIFSHHADIGKPKLSGSTVYNTSDQSYNLKGAGYNIWFGRDEFHYSFTLQKAINTGKYKGCKCKYAASIDGVY